MNPITIEEIAAIIKEQKKLSEQEADRAALMAPTPDDIMAYYNRRRFWQEIDTAFSTVNGIIINLEEEIQYEQ